MAQDFFTIGSTPSDETCVNVSSTEYYMDKMLDECNRFKKMLEEKFTNCNKVTFCVKTFPHDFGSYAEVAVKFDDTDCEALSQAIFIENNAPEKWTDTDVLLFEYANEDEGIEFGQNMSIIRK